MLNPVLVVLAALNAPFLLIFHWPQFAMVLGPPLGRTIMPTIVIVVLYMSYGLVRYLQTFDKHINSSVCFSVTYSEEMTLFLSALYCLTAARKYMPSIPIVLVQILFLIFFASVTMINC